MLFAISVSFFMILVICLFRPQQIVVAAIAFEWVRGGLQELQEYA